MEQVKFWLAIIGIVSSLGLALNTIIILFAALFHGGEITLSFLKFHEGWFEAVLCPICLILGVWGLIYLGRI
jgi:hypothetical protein